MSVDGSADRPGLNPVNRLPIPGRDEGKDEETESKKEGPEYHHGTVS
ncbi:MAG: hypothetical protein DIJKHBIC_01741 [Thermoanaerobaculia bacterium]|nr:hypothetical protein [Thermoanaerobaculia bacterium]